MKLGVGLDTTTTTASVDIITARAVQAERMGLDSLWVADRLLRPDAAVSRGDMPAGYSSTLDPLDTLSYLAGVTARIELGVSAVLALLHSPALLARRLATVDRLSGGRLNVALVMGWVDEEFRAAGLAMRRRGGRMDEFVSVLRSWWGRDPVEFQGEFYEVPRCNAGPKPVAGHPLSLYIGYHTGAGAARAGRIADGLHPYRFDLETLSRDVHTFRSAAAAAGRDTSLPILVRGRLDLRPDVASEPRGLFVGTRAQVLDDLKTLADLGVGHVFFNPEPASPEPRYFEILADLRASLA